MRANIGGMNTKSQILVPLHREDLANPSTAAGTTKLGFGTHNKKNNVFATQIDLSKQDSLQSQTNSAKKTEMKPIIQNKEKKVVKVMLDDEEDDSLRN